MHRIQNTRGIAFASAYLKYGFHEDGFTSGLLAACAADSTDPALPAATARTGVLSGTEIPITSASVRPPFAIRHADHHLRLTRAGVQCLWRCFDCIEGWGVREVVGSVGNGGADGLQNI